MEKRSNLLKEVRKRVQSVTYGNPIYRFMLDQGPVPESLRLAISDLWPGNAMRGQAILLQHHNLFGPDHDIESDAVMPHPARLLRDLRAVGSEAARRKAVSMILASIEQLEDWREEAWNPAALGDRISAWIAFHDFYAPVAPPDFHEKLIQSLLRQMRHLLHVQPTFLKGLDGLLVIKGLVFGGFGLDEGEKALPLALDMLRRLLAEEVLEDGGHIARNPSIHLHFVRYLIDLRAALRSVQCEVPPELSMSIERMIPALKLFRHGDGALALFQGGGEESSLWVEAVITLADARGRVLRRLPQTGYERITAGRSLLLVDVGGPPPRSHDAVAHAGLLSFEFSVGRERLIVNCGAAPENDPDWRVALAATAAHSALTLEDTNACDVFSSGIGHRNLELSAQRFEQAGVQSVEISHGGYASRYNVWHQRTLNLSADGEELRGVEILAGRIGYDYALRWHLHPAVQASLAHSGQAALLRTASGAGWRLRVTGADLSLESSVYCNGGVPRRSLQLKLSGRMEGDPTVIEWVLVREKKV